MSPRDYNPDDTATPATMDAAPAKYRGAELFVVLLLLLVSGAGNFVVVKVLFAAYGEPSAFFVSQGINVLFVIYGGLVVYPRMLPFGIGARFAALFGFGPILPSMRTAQHQRRFFIMGVLDCFGTFCTAMGSVYVPGQYQTLLNQSLIPATMAASALFLGTTFSTGQLASALLIVGGAALSIAPQLLQQHAHHPDDEVRAYAVVMYWLSNVPMALSAVYKEANFSRQGDPMDVTYLTQWVSIWQVGHACRKGGGNARRVAVWNCACACAACASPTSRGQTLFGFALGPLPDPNPSPDPNPNSGRCSLASSLARCSCCPAWAPTVGGAGPRSATRLCAACDASCSTTTTRRTAARRRWRWAAGPAAAAGRRTRGCCAATWRSTSCSTRSGCT